MAKTGTAGAPRTPTVIAASAAAAAQWVLIFQRRVMANSRAVMSQAAARLADVFTRFFSRDFDVSPTAVAQQFGADLRRGLDVNDSYCLAFGPDKGPACGFFAGQCASASRAFLRGEGWQGSDRRSR